MSYRRLFMFKYAYNDDIIKEKRNDIKRYELCQ